MKLKTISLLSLVTVLFASSALAADDSGVVTKADLKTTLVPDPGVGLRFAPEFWFTNDSDGLRQSVLRAGPWVKAASWLTLGANGYMSMSNNGSRDVRLEAQPELSWNFGDWKFNDRNRLAYRTMDNAVYDRFHYANEVKLTWTADWLSPFVAQEFFWDLSKSDFNQSRTTLGVGLAMNKDTRFDVGYMLRLNETAAEWAKEHFVVFNVVTSSSK